MCVCVCVYAVTYMCHFYTQALVYTTMKTSSFAMKGNGKQARSKVIFIRKYGGVFATLFVQHLLEVIFDFDLLLRLSQANLQGTIVMLFFFSSKDMVNYLWLMGATMKVNFKMVKSKAMVSGTLPWQATHTLVNSTKERCMGRVWWSTTMGQSMKVNGTGIKDRVRNSWYVVILSSFHTELNATAQRGIHCNIPAAHLREQGQ